MVGFFLLKRAEAERASFGNNEIIENKAWDAATRERVRQRKLPDANKKRDLNIKKDRFFSGLFY